MIRLKYIGLLFLIPVVISAEEAGSIRIRSIDIEPQDQRSLVESIIPVQPGDPYDSSVTDISKRLLVATDRFENVRVTWDDKQNILEIKASPRLTFESILWSGDPVPNSSDIQRNCIPPNESRDMSQERISQMTRCILQGLQGNGYLDAHVILNPVEANLELQVSLGERYIVDSVEWIGVKTFAPADFENEIRNRVGEFFEPMNLEADARAVRKYYLDRGYYFSEVFKPAVTVMAQSRSVRLNWRIEEAPKMQVVFRGDSTEEDLFEQMLEREETLPRWFADELTDEIETEFREKGYLEVKVDVKREMETDPVTEVKREVVTIRTRKGPLYLLEAPDLIGTNDREKVLQLYYDLPAFRKNKRYEESNLRKILKEEFIGLLQTNGFLDARLRSADFVIDTQTHRVKPVLYLQEGEQWSIDHVEISGLPEAHRNMQEVKDLQKNLKVSGYFDEAQIDKLQATLQRALVNVGYLDAKVERKIDRSQGRLSILIHVASGPEYHVARILIHGAIKTKYEVIRREVLLKVGEVFTEERVQDSVAHILRLGVARSVDIQAIEKHPQRGEVYVLVDVSEANRFRFELGPGYGTLDGLRATFRGTYANIGGAARRLTLYAKGSRELGDSKLPVGLLNPKSVPFIQRKVTLEYFEPTVLGWPLDGRLLFSHSKQDEKTFGLLRNAFTASIDYRLNRHWIFTTSYDLEFSDPFNIQPSTNTGAEQANRKRLTAVQESVLAEYVDDSFVPTKGLRSRTDLNIYDTRFGGDEAFWQISEHPSFYVPIWTFKKSKAIGFSLSLGAGFSGPYEDTKEVPIEKRFQVGGESSVRGYGQNSINPQGFEGGDSFFSFMSEVYLPLGWGIDLLGFFDGGNAFRSNGEFHPWDLRYGAGPGIRWNTPVGPLKFGYGFILARRTDGQGNGTEPVGHFYFGVGAL